LGIDLSFIIVSGFCHMKGWSSGTERNS
jgi:hypothetical protein